MSMDDVSSAKIQKNQLDELFLSRIGWRCCRIGFILFDYFCIMDKYLQILKQYWGYDAFRALQPEIIESIGSGRDTLGLMPTGGGKSLTFQVPALALDGICLVVTPLIALMKDQVGNLQKRGIKALCIHSGMTRDEINVTLDNCIFGGFKFLYLSPERLATEMFLAKLPLLKVNILAIDEAHCISQWGYDFRPSYLKVAEVRELIPQVPVLALTATATPQVVDDIMEKLHFGTRNVFQKSFARDNLAYVVRYSEDKEEQLVKILKNIKGSGVVYVRNRKKTREYAELLQRNNINSAWFHAGLKQDEKDRLQDDWTHDRIRIMVCTNAFGMGIDKPDVRVVVHMDAPNSLEAYFQEAGRCGRDGAKAFAVLLWSNHDAEKMNRSLASSFPDPEVIKRVYDSLGNFFQIAVGHGMGLSCDFNMGAFCKAYQFNIIAVLSSLKILERAGYIEFTEDMEMVSRIMFIVERDALYRVQVANEDLDLVIKVMLRSYTGLFTEYVNIDEELLAKRCNTTRQSVYEWLIRLNKMRIVKYIPQKKTPIVYWAQSREDNRYVSLPRSAYLDRKLDYSERIHHVINYGSSSLVCRSKLLLRYFGEKNAGNCGQCDVCLAKKKVALSADHFDEIKEKLQKMLIASPQSVEQLVRVSDFHEDEVLAVLRWLEEFGVIGLNHEGMLEWWQTV